MFDVTTHRVSACDSVTSPKGIGDACHTNAVALRLGVKAFLRDSPSGTYLIEQREDSLVLLRLSEGGPADEAFAPLALWPLLLPD